MVRAGARRDRPRRLLREARPTSASCDSRRDARTRTRLTPAAAHLRLSGDAEQRRRHAQRRRARWPRPSAPSISSSTSTRTASQGYVRSRRKAHRPRARLGDRRHRPAEHPGPRPLARRLDARESHAARCCSPPATAPKRPSATPRWTATPAAASRPSPASTRRSCAHGCAGWKRNGPLGRLAPASRAARRQRSRRPPPSCAPPAPSRPTKTT